MTMVNLGLKGLMLGFTGYPADTRRILMLDQRRRRRASWVVGIGQFMDKQNDVL